MGQQGCAYMGSCPPCKARWAKESGLEAAGGAVISLIGDWIAHVGSIWLVMLQIFSALPEIRESRAGRLEAGLAVAPLATYCRICIKSWVDAQRQPANPGKVALRKGDVADRQPSGSSHQASPLHEDRRCAD